LTPISPELLASYLDDALDEKETARIEQELRRSEPLRLQVRKLIQERDRGEHSIGAIWRRQRLSCPSRDQLGSSMLGGLDDDLMDYVQFHLRTIGCAFCLANLADLEAQQKEAAAQVQQRRRRYFQSSAGLLKPGERGA
jgi:hypothetical protein